MIFVRSRFFKSRHVISECFDVIFLGGCGFVFNQLFLLARQASMVTPIFPSSTTQRPLAAKGLPTQPRLRCRWGKHLQGAAGVRGEAVDLFSCSRRWFLFVLNCFPVSTNDDRFSMGPRGLARLVNGRVLVSRVICSPFRRPRTSHWR